MFIIVLSVLFFLSDFLVKKLALNLLTFNEPVVVIPKMLWLRLIFNQGAAFGILQGRVFVLIFIAILFLGMIAWWVRKNELVMHEKVFLSMIVGGALSNLWDRINLGYVVDYIDLGWWPIFNIADSLICVGCIAFIIMEFKKNKKQK